MTERELEQRYQNLRMDWRAMFVYDPSTGVVRLVGNEATRDGFASEMWRRKDNYRKWLRRWPK